MGLQNIFLYALHIFWNRKDNHIRQSNVFVLSQGHWLTNKCYCNKSLLPKLLKKFKKKTHHKQRLWKSNVIPHPNKM